MISVLPLRQEFIRPAGPVFLGHLSTDLRGASELSFGPMFFFFKLCMLLLGTFVFVFSHCLVNEVQISIQAEQKQPKTDF